jgi:N-formylglutamate deformylase
VTSFKLIKPAATQVPILLSVPHCGTQFPAELKGQYNQDLIAAPDDTDWFVHQLYDFAASMGITMMHSMYSRWVIDLNRDPESKPLYTDGRIITALCPATTFTGVPLYADKRKEVDQTEVNRRLEIYYKPYHDQIEKKLFELKSRFGKVLLWECHSIRQFVPTINPEKFPDLILGDNEGKTASQGIIDSTMKILKKSGYGVSHNAPFKGGYITRHFGKPKESQHALQLEMSKINYMDDSEREYDKKRADRVRKVLQKIFSELTSKWLS